MSTQLNERQSYRWIAEKMPDEQAQALHTYLTINPQKRGSQWPDALDEMLNSDRHLAVIERVYKVEPKAREYGVLPAFVALTMLYAQPKDFGKDEDAQPRRVMSVITARFSATSIEGTNPFLAMQEMEAESDGTHATGVSDLQPAPGRLRLPDDAREALGWKPETQEFGPPPTVTPGVRTLSATDLGIAQDDPGWAATVEEAIGLDDFDTLAPIDEPGPFPGPNPAAEPSQSEWMYAWQVWNPRSSKWELIGALMQGMSLPLVTTNPQVAEDLRPMAMAHMGASGQPIRLINFVPGAILDAIEPEDREVDDAI